MKTWKKNPLTKMILNSIVDLPSPSNISTMWNFGSILGMCLMIQVLTGLFLAMHYCPNISMAFDSTIHLYREVNMGWMIRTIHTNGASLFFMCLYTHIGRGMFYSSYMLKETWIIGTIILMATMATAFMGYVLPWGQMSFWGATVITNLLSAIPYMGNSIVQWLWGGFAVDNATLNRFFALHFILPFLIMAMVIIHLIFLHQSGSLNPLGTPKSLDKIPFHPYFTIKDVLGFNTCMLIFLFMNTLYPNILMDPENFSPANPLSTPIHIQPEWYFLFAYAILRSIPNKLGGVLALLMSILVLLFMPLTKKKFQSNQFYPINNIMFWMFTMNILMLTWIGAKPVETPFIIAGQIMTILYFLFFPLNMMTFKMWDKTLK